MIKWLGRLLLNGTSFRKLAAIAYLSSRECFPQFPGIVLVSNHMPDKLPAELFLIDWVNIILKTIGFYFANFQRLLRPKWWTDTNNNLDNIGIPVMRAFEWYMAIIGWSFPLPAKFFYYVFLLSVKSWRPFLD